MTVGQFERNRPAADAGPLLTVQDLRVVHTGTGLEIVHGVDLSVEPGQTVAFVGESGSGKSLTAKALVGLLPVGLRATGSVVLSGHGELMVAGDATTPANVRGEGIGMLLQDPFTMLNPLVRIGLTMTETLRSTIAGRDAGRAQLRAEAERRLAEVGVDQPDVLRKFPWELSGGMRQRVGLAAAIAKDPGVLIVDEPTTALDATTQREVLRLLRDVQARRGMGLVLITHEMRIAFSMSDRIAVMRSGEVVDSGTPAEVEAATTTYTRALLAADLPLDRRLDDLGAEKAAEPGAPVRTHDVEGRARGTTIVVDGLHRTFGHGAAATSALDGVSLRLAAGRSLGVIGESGSGKTTLARCLLGLDRAHSGTIEIGGVDATDRRALPRTQAAALRGRVQCVFQDPYSSLNPAHSIGYALREAVLLRAGGPPARQQIPETVEALLASVGLPSQTAAARPASLSGGQRQRVAIARALAMRPDVLVCDEPVAALDLSVQAQVLEVLRNAQDRGVQLLFITHDLPVVRQMVDDVVVLLEGRVVETGPTSAVLDDPQHPYTRRLVAAVPTGAPNWLDDESSEPAVAGTDKEAR